MKPRARLSLFAMSLLSLLTGCNRLPAVNAKTIRYESSYPIGGTTIRAEGVEVTDCEVKAATYSRTTKLWGFSQSVEIEGYRRDRTPGDAGKTTSPLAP